MKAKLERFQKALFMGGSLDKQHDEMLSAYKDMTQDEIIRAK